MKFTSSVAEILTNTNTRASEASVSDIKIDTNTSSNTKTLTQVHRIANSLSDKLHNPSRFEFYCKIAWHLPEHLIWNYLEAALKGRQPERLFSYLCNKALHG